MLKKRNLTTDKNEHIAAGRIIAGGILGFLLTVVLTVVAALAVTKEALPMSSTQWLGSVIILISSFFAALFATRSNRKKLICGFLAALLYGSGMMICCMLLFSAPMQFGRMLLSLAALVAGTMMGVVVSGMRR